MAKIYIRHGVIEMLQELKDAGFEIILFTAGNIHYMSSVVKHVLLDSSTGEPLFHHMLSRSEMRILADLPSQTGELVKDLSCLLEGRQMRDIVLIDNSECKAQL